MAFLFLAGVTTAYWAEARGNPLLTAAGADQTRDARCRPGGNMEGKEVRFGIANSALFATVTTDASCGAINGWHDSFTPLGGLVPLANIMLGEVIFGGVGAGMYGILVFIILSVFIAGLMVGRTPEYLGKKIQAYDVQMAMLVVLVFPLTILVLHRRSRSVSPSFGTSSIANPGPHGLSEILYAFTSGTGNNGSAFGGLNANTHWYNVTLGVAMLIGRFFMIIPMLAIAGSLGRKKRVPPSPGTFPVTTPLFAALLVGVDRHRRRADVLPGAQPRPDRRALADGAGTGVLMAHASRKVRSIWDPAIVRGAVVRRAAQAASADDGEEPGDVRRRGRQRADDGAARCSTRVAGRPGLGFELQITFWLWLTVLFANFAEAMAEGRGKAQADTLRKARTETVANRIVAGRRGPRRCRPPALRKDDVVMVKAGEFIPADGEIIEGVASVDESAITGESAPVIRESGGDRIGGHRRHARAVGLDQGPRSPPIPATRSSTA